MRGVICIAPVIVTDVRYRMSLPVIRALGRSGYDVIAAERRGSDSAAALGFYSKYSKQNIFSEDPAVSPDGFIKSLEDFSKQLSERPCIIPVGITSLLAMCRERERVAAFADAALPSLCDIELANDKSRLIPFAKSVGVPVPETTFLRDGESVSELAERISFPAVIKLPAGEMLGLDPKDRYCIVKSKAEFLEKYPLFSARGGEILVQQYITGDGYGVSCVFGKNSEPLEIFCHRRLREYPTSGGPSCFCESADMPYLADCAVKLLKALNWVGVAMVEFKGDEKNGYYLMEINPRFWGSSALAPNSGCNIPLALVRAARGEEAAPYSSFSPSYKVGHRMRFLIQDTLCFPSYLKQAKNKPKYFFSHLGSLLNPAVSDGALDIRDARASFQYLKCALKKKDRIVR